MSERWGLIDSRNFFLIAFSFIIVSASFNSISTSPVEGDSLAYHIPIAEMISKGEFWQPHKYSHLNYYPASAETLLAFLVLLNIPLNLFNVFAMILLFFALRELAEEFGLNKYYSDIFAVSVSTMHIIIRWLNSQIIDIWLTLFFVLTLSLLMKPKSTLSYFFKLGTAAGLLTGAKYTGPIYFVLLFLIYGWGLVKLVNLKKLVLFLVPFTFFGLSWYIRNFILVGNPIYPQPILGLAGYPGWEIFTSATWEIILSHPYQMFNALFGEYLLWIFTLFVPLWYLLKRKVIKDKEDKLLKLILLGIGCLILYLFLYTSSNYQIMVSSVRYSIPAFVCFILAVFLLFNKYKKEKLLVYLSFLNLLPILQFSYQPKIILLLFPVLCLILGNDAITAQNKK